MLFPSNFLTALQVAVVFLNVLAAVLLGVQVAKSAGVAEWGAVASYSFVAIANCLLAVAIGYVLVDRLRTGRGGQGRVGQNGTITRRRAGCE